MNRITLSLYCLFGVFSMSRALQFYSPVEIRKNNAIIKATFYYSDTLKAIRYDYTDPIRMTELYDFPENVKYKYCSSCEAGFISESFPTLTYKSSDSKATSGSVVTYTRYNDPVQYLKYTSGKLTEFKWNGAIYKLSNYQTLSNSNKLKYTDFSTSCPRPVCKRVIDIIFVLDESGSIAEEEWEKTIDFCKNIVNSYEIGYDAAQVGIVGFGSFGIKYLDLSYSKTKIIQKFNYLLTRQHRGGTCTGCGLMIAKTMFDGAKKTQRTKSYNPEHLLITITDGEVTHPDYYSCQRINSVTTHCGFCVGCCSRSDNSRPYRQDYKSGTCTARNKTFTLTGSTKCSKRTECTKGTLNRDGYSCSGCWCDAACKNVVCDKCTVTGYTTRSWKYCYNVEGCRVTASGIYKSNFTNSVKQIKTDDRLLSIAIGVGGYSKSELQSMATTLQGVQTVFGLADYSLLGGILDKMIAESCTKIEKVEDCGSNCRGFCGCGRKCYCPTCEKYTETCVKNTCTVDNKNAASSGCVLSHVTCANNKCNIPTMSNSTPGCCAYTEKNCDDHKFCTDDSCVPGKGCVNTVNKQRCDDGNGCTIDKCDDIRGCSNVLLETCEPPNKCKVIDTPCVNTSSTACVAATFKDKCTCDNPCEIPSCDMETGDCKCTPKDCSTNNSCEIGYCEDGVCLKKDNMTRINECHQLSTDCSMGKCQNGECVIEDIPCTACQNNKTFVDWCEGQSTACEKYKCKDVKGEAKCEKYWEMALNPDPCYGETCNPELGFQSNPMELTKTENCTEYVCKDAKYEAVKELCPPEDKCYTYMCGEDNSCIPSSKCTPYNGNDKCQVFVGCTEEDGCMYRDVECESGSCFDSYCDTESGDCVIEDNSSNCNIYPDDLCIHYKCNETHGCVYENMSCDDNNPCTIDYCENGTCFNEPKCVSDDYCLVAECTDAGTCVFSTRECPPANDTCFYSVCEEGNCTVKMDTAAFLDVCGDCISKYGDIYNKSGEVCIGALKRGEFAAAIGAAAVAGIVVAAVIAAVVIGVSSTMGVRELIKRSKMTEDSGLNNNPLYEASNNEGTNPMFLDGED